MKDRNNASGPVAARPASLGDALLWPRDLTGRCARVVAIGSRRLLVENHTGILELTETCVRLNTRCGPITVTGRSLRLCEARRGAAIIRGAVQTIALPSEGGACPR